MTDARKAADLAAARARHGVPADGLSDEQWEATQAQTRLRDLAGFITHSPRTGTESTPLADEVADNHEHNAANLQDEIRACGREPAETRPAQLIRDLRAQLAVVTAERDAMAERCRSDLADALGVSRTWQISDLLIEARAVKANRVALTERLARRNRLESVAREALETFGNGRQTLKAIEECAEFIVAAHHYGDAKITLEEYADEVAGVAITNAQIMLLLGDEHGPPAFERQLAKIEAAIVRAKEDAK